jgi:glycosyltransferase involved in cell wall biosynthesis
MCSNVSTNLVKIAIESCLTQSFSDFELIFVANGPDASSVAKSVKEWFKQDLRVRVFQTDVRQLSFSLSLGLHFARAELIARMDSDDVSCPDRLQHQFAFMAENPEVVVLGSCYEIIDENGNVVRTVQVPNSNLSIRRGLLKGNPFCHPSVMFRRKAILQSGGYIGGPYAEDYDLWARLSLNPQHLFANLDKVLLGYRMVGAGMARRSRSAYASMAASQFRNFLIGGGIQWLFATLVSVGKLIIRSKSPRK